MLGAYFLKSYLCGKCREMRESKMWNELSMKEKADIIKVGVKHGIANCMMREDRRQG